MITREAPLRTLALLSAALLPGLMLLRALVRLVLHGGHAGRLVTCVWAWSFYLPIPYRFRVQALRMLGYSFLVGAVAVIRDEAGRHLLARHTYPVGTSRQEVWGLPGGAVEKYESIPDALRRELAQELGLEITVERLLLVNTGEPPRLEFVFACSLRNGQFRPSSEVAEIGWFGPDQEPDGMSSHHQRLLTLVAVAGRETMFA
jgi:ADP-ribose pyrophosphatase YjhB (NUDIX family)